MISLIAIMFMSLIIRVQSNIQYALGQTAKEISGYYYLVDKLGLAAATSGASSEATQADKTVQTIVDFSSSAKDTGKSMTDIMNDLPEDFSKIENFDTLSGDAKQMGQNIKATYENFKTMEASVKQTLSKDNIKDNFKQVLAVFAKTAVNGVVSNVVAPWVCESLMSRYLTADYEAMGIHDVSFLGSQFLADRRSIKVQITYQLDLEKYTLGFVKTPITFRQAASTAAWVRPDNKNLVSVSSLKDKYQD